MIIINTKKFKTLSLSIRFKEEINQENVSLRSLLPDVMTSKTTTYNTKKKINEALENLYGSSIDSRTFKLGNLSVIEFKLNIINPSFMEEGFFNSALLILNEVIFGHKRLPKKYFELEKNLLVERIIAVDNNKTLIALNNLIEIMFRDEKYAIKTYGKIKEVKKITYEELNNYYYEVVNNNDYDVIISGDVTAEIKRLTSEYFKPRNNYSYNPIDAEIHEVTKLKTIKKTDDINQVKLNIGYDFKIKYHDSLYYEAVLFNVIFGSSVNSRLFKTIREKNALCYYISSNFDPYKGFLYVYAGIDKTNIKVVKTLIFKELEDLKTNYVNDEELKIAKKHLINSLKETIDNQNRWSNNVYQERLLKRNLNLNDKIKMINSVTKKGILTVSKKVIPDTIYTLEPEVK